VDFSIASPEILTLRISCAFLNRFGCWLCVGGWRTYSELMVIGRNQMDQRWPDWHCPLQLS
jgi:hypothetical protein